MLSGNLSFLNWLTMMPALAAFDDASLAFLFPAATVAHVQALNAAAGAAAWGVGAVAKEAVYMAACALLVFLSAPVIRNILSPYQVVVAAAGGGVGRVRGRVCAVGVSECA